MTQAVQTTGGQQAAAQKSVKSYLLDENFKTQVALVLPKHLTPDRFVRVALSCLSRVPKLSLCTPQSVLRCMMTCSELGIEPDGRRAHLIPFANRKTGVLEATLIIDYKGLVELAMNSGTVSSIFAQTVCENDLFEYDTGEIHHRIDFKKPRGVMYAVYCVVTFKDGGKHTEVMTREEVEKIRRRSKAANEGPWVTDWEEMCKKTVFRRSSKWIKLSPEVQDALEREDDWQPSSLVQEVASTAALPEPTEEPAPEPQGELQPDLIPAEIPPADVPAQPGPQLTKEQGDLQKFIESNGFTFAELIAFGRATNNIPDADSIPDFSAIPEAVCRRLLRAKIGLLKYLTDARNRAKGGV